MAAGVGRGKAGQKVAGKLADRMFRDGMRAHHFASLVALFVVLAACLFAEYQAGTVSRQAARADVGNSLGMIRAKLEGDINSNIQLVRGLVAVISTEPNMTQERFSELAGGLFEARSQLRNIAAAPDLVITYMHPIAGNETAIGLDYREHPDQRAAALRARDTGDLVLAGPFELVQGGQGLIGRYPVFVEQEDGEKRFWGIVAAVVDVERLYRQSGLLGDLPISVAIRGKDGLGPSGEQFFGDPSVFADDPVLMDVALPSGRWQIAAVPRAGWPRHASNVWTIRTIFLAAAALIIVPILISGRLAHERHRHIEELRQREEELERMSQRLELALATSRIGIWDFDTRDDELYWDGRMKELYGLPEAGEPSGYATWRDALHPADRQRAEREFRDVIEGAARYESEFRVVRADGVVRHVRAIGTAYTHSTGVRRIAGVNWDVTADVELKDGLKRARDLAEARTSALEKAKAQMEYNALHDPLTGLPNRRYLDIILGAEAELPNAAPSALLHVDLDRFKQINDTLGHAAGDMMLCHAASVLMDSVREGDFVARVGGDEFVIVVMGQTSAAILASLAATIVEVMRRPVRYEGQECRAGVSAGIAMRAGTSDARQLLVNADIALYEAKSRGRNRYEFFTESLQTAVVHGKRTADDIMRGIEENQFVAYYQPQFDARTMEVMGVEVLVRWDHPERGLLAPAAFLATAEEINVVSTIDQRVLEQALLQSYRWQAAGIDIPRIAVNVSSGRLHEDSLVESLRALNIRPGSLSFELLESTFLDGGDDVVAANIAGIKELGIDIEIDDFGTGHASIVSLLKLKPKRLKIDRQLVMPITQSSAQRHLISSITDIGRSLHIEVIAEGVETMEHVRILRRLGCTGLQGYVFAKPMSANELMDYMRERQGMDDLREAVALS
jgi:diguanylate cyclase (GGDEF)-like protein/PAS domain S-box-containing protein